MRTTRVYPVAALAAAFAVGACSEGPVGPPDGGAYAISPESGDGQFAEPGATLADPLAAKVTDRDGDPVEGTTVFWNVIDGVGAAPNPATSETDSLGVATTRLRLGSETGTYRVEASFEGLDGLPASFQADAVLPPEISAISPDPVEAGEIVLIAGENFSSEPADNVVLFGNVRGTVITASATDLEVRVPLCLPSREVDVTVQLGPVRGSPGPLEVLGDPTVAPDLAVGQAVGLSDPAELACLRMPGDEPGSAFLVVPQNATAVSGQAMPFQLAGVVGMESAVLVNMVPSTSRASELDETGFGAYPAAWELRLRRRERGIAPGEVIRREEGESGLRTFDLAPAATPQVGDQQTFQVINLEDEFTEVTARVQHVSDHAILYQDVDAPGGGFSAADFEYFGGLFDDPIFDTDVGVFGEPSDIDDNGRIIILFTPVVNEYTPEDSDGFVAGFFYGLDLTDREGSNGGEIFYSMVPDPAGDYGDPRQTQDVLNTVPPVLAHELQHMIHFNQRFIAPATPASIDEDLWLSEALAHMAEQVVGDTLEARGNDLWVEFKNANYSRAFRYLEATADASLIASTGRGTLEERGAGWLFLMHLIGHYGGADLLAGLTQTTTAAGVDNVTSETGESWETLARNWAVALWADDAPELDGVAVDPLFTFPNLDLRTTFAQSGFPLQPATSTFSDFLLADTLAAGSPAYLLLDHTSLDSSRTMSLGLSGALGAPFPAQARPHMMLLRIE